ncbi:hypothetical protein AAG570_004924 [Ranatra chinensis]|uniref:DNA fragmentation factor 40 C-terminal domain-containing protein n=1 Tax=Ranatra chinensis TaxID=642074 RepID=A0ABD0XYY5_9HEMI
MSQNLKEKVRVLARLVAAQEEEDTLEEAQKKTWKEEDMVGLDTRCTTKEAFMCRRCEDRIRGYLYKTCSDVRNSPVYRREDGHRLREVLEAAIADLKRALAGERYMGHYFDRNCTYGKMALCDRRGKFSCAGAWDAGRCNHRNGKGHTINPYRSREQRIVFSTWNLDHRIERARSIVPALLGAAVLRTVLRVNTDYFFRLLFTHHNLGLVHIVCHEKSARPSASCDPDQTVLVALTTVDGQKKGGGGGWAQTTERAVSA